MINLFRHGIVATLSLFIALSLFSFARAGDLTLALANSTCKAIGKVGDAYRASQPVQFTYICKSSGLLAKGLRGGVLQADLFVSADREWMDFAIENGLVAPDTVSSPWSNVLVVATAQSSPMQRFDWRDLASDKVTTVLIGDPSTAPFGRHAKEALEASGLWDRVKHKIQTRKHVELLAATLAKTDPGTVGILFKSNMTDQLRLLHTVDQTLHKPIRYYMAPLKATANKAEVTALIAFMQSKAAQGIFQAEGFIVRAP